MRDFLLGTVPGWGAKFRSGVLARLATPLLAGLAAQWSVAAGAWVLGGGLLMALGNTTPLFGGLWRGLDVGPP